MQIIVASLAQENKHWDPERKHQEKAYLDGYKFYYPEIKVL